MVEQKARSALIMSLRIFILLNFLYSFSSAQTKLWTTAYYAGWMQGQNNDGYLPAQAIDFSAVTHIIHFALIPNSDGTLDTTANTITKTNSSELISLAHQHGVKVLISLGGGNSEEGFRSATSLLNLNTFVANLISFITVRGYDGVDIDWEPLQSVDATLYVALITSLRTALNAIGPGIILTTANGSQADIISQIYPLFDQINLMTYDMSGAWPGWVTWYNSPVYNGNYQFPCCPGNYLPSVDNLVNAFIANGVPANKLGIGIDFYGYVWNGGSGTTTGGVTQARQAWIVNPSVKANVPYFTIMHDYYQSQYYKWDDTAKASYLSIDNPGSANDKFISYDDEKTVQAKFDYVRTKGIGGLMIWELGGGYRTDMPHGKSDLLLQAVKNAREGIAGVGDSITKIPNQFALSQNYPNPFNPLTIIQFSLPITEHVELNIYNILGEKVAELVDETMGAGIHNITWDASNMASGIYICRLRSSNNILTKKMTLIK